MIHAMRKEFGKLCDGFWQRYASAVAGYPWVFVVAISVICCILTTIAVLTNELPNFKDPRVGFEPRGTTFSNRLNTWNNLLDSTRWNGQLSLVPHSVLRNHQEINKKLKNEAIRHQGNPKSNDLESLDEEEDADEEPLSDDKHFSDGHGHSKAHGFCNSPDRAYSRFIFQSTNAERSLLSRESLLSMCDMDSSVLRHSDDFQEACELIHDDECCPSWSLSNYVAFSNNKTSCFDISHEDVEHTLKTLEICSSFYRSTKLADCLFNDVACDAIPSRCWQDNHVYDMLHFIVDVNFVDQLISQNSTPTMKYNILFLPIAMSSNSLNFYLSLPSDLNDGITQIVAMELGLRDVVFDQFVIGDLAYVGASTVVIVLLMCMYTRSIALTFVVILSIFMSLGVSYFIYTTVLRIAFFPFINCMAVIVCLGIGVDDAFIYSKMWNIFSKKDDDENDLSDVIRSTSSHAMLSMFVTTVTTASAFFATYSSSITAIKCFSVFAGFAIIAHFIIIFWCLPAILTISTRWKTSADETTNSNRKVLLRAFHSFFVEKPKIVCKSTFSKVIPMLVYSLRHLWIFLFLTSISACIYVIYSRHQGLLPNDLHFQLLDSNHPFELYLTKFGRLFSFEKMKLSQTHALPMRLIWGIDAIDNGDFLDPHDRGKLSFDDAFNMSSKESQEFLYDLCLDVRRQPFFKPTTGLHLLNCFIETFKYWMTRECFDDILGESYHPCCRNSPFPFEPNIFDECLPKAIEDLAKLSPAVASLPGPRFSRADDEIKAIVVEFTTIFNFSLSFDDMDDFVNAIDPWLQTKLASAPPTMKNGWFVGDLKFYDLQKSLLFGSVIAVGVSGFVSCFLIFVLTANFRLSLICVTNMMAVILFVFASFVLIGWTLNVFQAIIISLLIGLSVDFIMHYGFAYRLSPTKNSCHARVKFSISCVASPVSMSFVTTFVAGLFMSLSSVLVYAQVGSFLMLLSFISWFTSTFILQSCLLIVGPSS